jgi:hypothetical protein
LFVEKEREKGYSIAKPVPQGEFGECKRFKGGQEGETLRFCEKGFPKTGMR